MNRLALAVLCAAGLLLYLRSPIDLVPDRIGPAGLLDDLLALAIAFWWLRRQWGGADPGGRRGAKTGSADTGRGEDEPFDPWEVLGVPRGASQEEIRRAYHARLREYHPDRVDGLGPDLRDLAHRRTLEIRRAYDALREGAGRG